MLPFGRVRLSTLDAATSAGYRQLVSPLVSRTQVGAIWTGAKTPGQVWSGRRESNPRS
jgi:hypothetical protein